MDNIILFSILFLFILFLLYLLLLKKQSTQKELVSCFNRRFGCCPDNITSKKNLDGTNCRGF
jgi:hypothetical protein